MAQLCDHLRFAFEAFDEFQVRCQFWLDNLDGYLAVDRQLLGAIDITHACPGNPFKELIAIDGLAAEVVHRAIRTGEIVTKVKA
jgi:hypothetical protein